MKARHLLMGAALTGAAALVVFGDRTPSGSDVAEAVVQVEFSPPSPGELELVGQPAGNAGTEA